MDLKFNPPMFRSHLVFFVLQLWSQLIWVNGHLEEDLLSPNELVWDWKKIELCNLHGMDLGICWGPQRSLRLRKEGMTGVVMQENQGSDQPLNIKAPNGQTWWYQETPWGVSAPGLGLGLTGGGSWNSKYTWDSCLISWIFFLMWRKT